VLFCSYQKKGGAVMTQGERVKEIRKALGLTLEKFGNEIGLKKNSVSQIENGVNELTEANLMAICRADWHGNLVNENWLRTGDGKMFLSPTREDEIAKMTSNLFKEEESSFKSRLILALSRLDEDEWAVLEKIAKELENGLKKKD
jgi:transcriptional regulator with XRE-family HTH domain